MYQAYNKIMIPKHTYLHDSSNQAFILNICRRGDGAKLEFERLWGGGGGRLVENTGLSRCAYWQTNFKGDECPPPK